MRRRRKYQQILGQAFKWKAYLLTIDIACTTAP